LVHGDDDGNLVAGDLHGGANQKSDAEHLGDLVVLILVVLEFRGGVFHALAAGDVHVFQPGELGGEGIAAAVANIAERFISLVVDGQDGNVMGGLAGNSGAFGRPQDQTTRRGNREDQGHHQRESADDQAPPPGGPGDFDADGGGTGLGAGFGRGSGSGGSGGSGDRSEEHTSELQSLTNLVCR